MTYEEPNHYTADEGKTFLRVTDNFIMGTDMYLYSFIDGTPDTIENYTEIDDPNPKEAADNIENNEEAYDNVS